MARRVHRSRSGYSRRPKSRGGGLFRPPWHRWLVDIVSFETPGKARSAARKLLSIMRHSRRSKRLHLLRGYASLLGSVEN